MKYVLALVAIVAMLSFVSSTKAADKPPKPHPAHFVKIDEKGMTVKGGAKGTGHEHVIKIDDSTKFTIDGKDVTKAEAEKQLTADEYVEVTGVKGEPATLIAASTTAPATPAPAPAK